MENIFEERTIVLVTFKGKLTRHHLREATPEEDLQFQRMLSSSRINGRKRAKDLEWAASDKSLTAAIWLYDQICENVEVEVDEPRRKAKEAEGPQPRFEPIADFVKVVVNRVKREAIAAFQNGVSQEEEDEAKNS